MNEVRHAYEVAFAPSVAGEGQVMSALDSVEALGVHPALVIVAQHDRDHCNRLGLEFDVRLVGAVVVLDQEGGTFRLDGEVFSLGTGQQNQEHVSGYAARPRIVSPSPIPTA